MNCTPRQENKQKNKWTTLIIVDSQATKNTCNASVKSKGFCFYKATNDIKRHLGIDSLGFPFFTHCTKASVSDDMGLIEMFKANIDYFKAKPVNIPKITVMVDHGYNLEYLTKELEKIYSQIMTKIRFNNTSDRTRTILRLNLILDFQTFVLTVLSYLLLTNFVRSIVLLNSDIICLVLRVMSTGFPNLSEITGVLKAIANLILELETILI